MNDCSVFPLLPTARAEVSVETGWYLETEEEDDFSITKSEEDNDKKKNPSLTHIFVAAAGTRNDSFTDLHNFFKESKFSPDLMNSCQYAVVKKATMKNQSHEKSNKPLEKNNTELFDSLLNDGAHIYLAGLKEMVTPAEKDLKTVAEKKGLELVAMTRARY